MNPPLPSLLPVSAVIPTIHRPQALARTLKSLQSQDALPAELIVVDASNEETNKYLLEFFTREMPGLTRFVHLNASEKGAATQRIQGLSVATQSTILFLDDDVIFEPGCLSRMWSALNSSPDIGGASAMITNQRYHPPGLLSSYVFHVMGGHGPDFAGQVFGPAVNLLPEDRETLPEIVPMEWLNTTCTLYRKEALPDPPFSSYFTGYSLMEDVTLSIIVSRKWRLVNARTARIYHDSQPGAHKNDVSDLSAMETVNRNYVMTKIMGHDSTRDYLKQLALELFSLFSSLQSYSGIRTLPAQLVGRWRGWQKILQKHGGSRE